MGDSRSAAAHLASARSAHAANDHDTALEQVAAALALDANLAEGYLLLADLLAGLGLRREAEAAKAAARGERVLLDGLAGPVADLVSLAFPRLSACLIVKNEAKNLSRCLASLKGRVDEIVVLDTGSTDGTPAIAEAAGAKVGRFAWVDDFSAARNAAARLATGDWILAIDADEVLDPGDAAMLRRALRTRANGGYYVCQRNAQPDGGSFDNLTLRLYQRHPEIGFTGRLHEDVTQSLDRLGWPYPVLPTVVLRHDGYLAEAILSADKLNRNFALALKDLEDSPAEPRAWLNLARSAQAAGFADAALEAYRKLGAQLRAGLEIGDGLLQAYVTESARLAMSREAFDEAATTASLGLERLPAFPPFLLARALAYRAEGRTKEALADLENGEAGFARYAALGATLEPTRQELASCLATWRSPA